MTINQYNQAVDIINKVDRLTDNLKQIDDTLASATTDYKVQINNRWDFTLPTNALKARIQARRIQILQDISTLKAQFDNL